MIVQTNDITNLRKIVSIVLIYRMISFHIIRSNWIGMRIKRLVLCNKSTKTERCLKLLKRYTPSFRDFIGFVNAPQRSVNKLIFQLNRLAFNDSEHAHLSLPPITWAGAVPNPTPDRINEGRVLRTRRATYSRLHVITQDTMHACETCAEPVKNINFLVNITFKSDLFSTWIFFIR